jgi:phosphoserine phosphatase
MNQLVAVASDLEGTLTSSETWRAMAAWLREHDRAAAYTGFLRARFWRYVGSKVGLVDKRDFQNRWIEELPGLFAGFTLTDFRAVAEWVVEQHLWPNRKTHVISELETHQRAGKRVILASGTYQPVLEAFAARLNAEAIGSPLEVQAGTLTGRLAGSVNVGSSKAIRLRNALGGHLLEAAYGDTLPDQEMLEMAHHGVVIPSDAKLEALAASKGWRILRA